MLTKRAKYALRALLYLADRQADGPVLIARLANDELIPKKFLERILLDLNKHGFLQSRKGKGGGYSLAKGPDHIMIGDVIRLMDGPLAPVSCVSKTAYARCQDCRAEATCAIRPLMKEVRDAIALIVDNTTLATMMANATNDSVGWTYEI